MGDTIREALERILGRHPLEARLESLRLETGGLLDDHALLALVADEEGVAETPFTTLDGLREGGPVFTRCRVEAVGPTREFQGSGGAGRLRKLLVSDGTRSVNLTLWGEETGLVERLGIAPGALVRVLSGTFKETRYGPEIQVGRTGFIVVEATPAEEGPPAPVNISELGGARGRVVVRGVLTSLSSSGRGRARTVVGRIFDGTGECEVDFSTAPQDCLEGLGPGLEVEVSGAAVRLKGSIPSLICSASTKVRIVG